MQDVRGYNPYKFGMAGGSDSHNTGSPYRQDNFYGGHAQIDGTVDRRMAGVMAFGTIDVRLENPGGLTGVWAEENTRASLWDAMYRKETFGTSGVHIKVRFFGGWGYNKDILNASDWVHQSYANGVPMGADLPPLEGHGSDVRRLGGERPDIRAISTASRSSRAGPRTARASRRSSTWPGPATASPTSGRAGFRRSRAPWTWRKLPTPTTSARRN